MNSKEQKAKATATRMETAVKKIEKLGFCAMQINASELEISNDSDVICKYFPFTGWATGKQIVDGRGLKTLLTQLKTIER